MLRCFFINLPAGGLAGAILLFTRIPDAYVKPPARDILRDFHNKFDLIGFVLFAPFMVMLLLALQWGGNM